MVCVTQDGADSCAQRPTSLACSVTTTSLSPYGSTGRKVLHNFCAKYVTRDTRAKPIVRLLHLSCWLGIDCSRVDLTEPIDIYSEWIDAADAAEKEAATTSSRRTVASSSRPPRAPSVDSDD